MTNALFSAEQVRILSIELITTELGKPIILAGANQSNPIVAEFNIYEDITLPYLTASMALLDDHDMYRFLKLNGTEKVTIRYEIPTKESEPFEKTFTIVNIPTTTKINDFASVLSFNMIEDIGYFDKLQKFSKVYDGVGEQIIEKIVQDKLSRQLDRTFARKQSFQKAFRYIVPYQTPLEAVNNILQKMTTDNGFPFFLFSSVYSDDFILRDLETIISEPAVNKGKPYTFTQGINASDTDFKTQALSITSFESVNIDDTLLLAQKGAIGSKLSLINITTGEYLTPHVDMLQHMTILIDNGIIPREYSSLFVNDNFVPDPSNNNASRLPDYDSRVMSAVMGKRTYPNDDLEGYSEETSTEYAKNQHIRNNILHHLTKNIYRIYVPGVLFLNKDPRLTVGSQIEVLVYKNKNVSSTMATVDVVDERRSGNFIILAKRHIFDVVNERHNVSLEIGKISEQGRMK